ncbi:MAG: diacylglycerol kinase family protein [Myxococcota bacterium]
MTPERVAVIVNGNAKQVTEDLVDMLEEIIRSGDLFVSRSLEEGQDIARRIVEGNYPTVLTGGGDGTFTQMVTWICKEAKRQRKDPPRFGLLRLGTGNAIAWVLGAQNQGGRGVAVDLGRLHSQGGSRKLRLVEVNGVMTPFAGFGVDAMALQDYADMKAQLAKVPGLKRLAAGGLAYGLSIGLKSMPKVLMQSRGHVRIYNEGDDAVRLGIDGQPVGAPIAQDELIFDGPFRGVLLSTIPYWGFGARIFPFAEEREDRFNLRIVDIGSVDVAWNIRAIWKGTYRDDRVHDFLCERVRLEFEGPTALEIGGDPVGTYRVATGSLAEPIDVVDYSAPPPVRQTGG